MTTRRRMLLVAHTGRPDVDITARKVAATLAEAGIDLVASADESRELGLTGSNRPTTGTATAASIEIVLAIGGDGTLLRAAEHARPLSRPGPGHQPGPGRVPHRSRRRPR